jgi:uncharacterized membrane protein YkvA (DUF1232 family)
MDTPSLDVSPVARAGTIPPHAPLKERIGKQLLARFGARRRLGAPLERIPENLHRTAEQLSLGLELIEDFRAGRYRAISWGSVAVLTGALLYAVSPADVLPDAMLGLGGLDDAIILALATRLVRRQLEDYCEFRGYSWEDYFASPTKDAAKVRPSKPVTVEPVDLPAN